MYWYYIVLGVLLHRLDVLRPVGEVERGLDGGG